MPNDYSRLEHLKMIQAAIGRMAQNSFVLKGWSVTLITGMIVLAIDKGKAFAWLALFPAVVFWGLDAYYLRQERLFRALHDSVCKDNGKLSPFSLSTAAHDESVSPWWKTLWAPTVLSLHGMVAAVVVIVLYVMTRK